MDKIIYNARYRTYTSLGTLIEWIHYLCYHLKHHLPGWEQAPSWVCPGMTQTPSNAVLDKANPRLEWVGGIITGGHNSLFSVAHLRMRKQARP